VNVAYIISAYKLPAMLVRLVGRLDAPGTSIFIHVDAKTSERVYRAMAEPLADRPDVHFLPRHPCHWGDFGHVRATLEGLRALIASGTQFDYVVLLTGQDYPLKSNPEIAGVLREAAGGVLMDYMPIPNDRWTDGGSCRFENWHFRLAGRTLAFPGTPFGNGSLNAAWLSLARLLRLRRAFPEGMRPYGGSSYWTMPADCARYVETWRRTHPELVRFFRHVHVPDEIFFQSIVMNSPFRDRVARDDLRWVDWQAGGDHPRVLSSADFDTLMRSDKLFARKFDPSVDGAVLDRIDHALDARQGRVTSADWRADTR
jgi:hypothetical protein